MKTAMFPYLPHDGLQPILGFVTAGLSTATIWLSQVPGPASGWMEMGGTIGLIGGLSYGCVTLWKALQEQRRESAAAMEKEAERQTKERTAFLAAKDALELEIRTDWKRQNEKLIEVLNKLDPDT